MSTAGTPSLDARLAERENPRQPTLFHHRWHHLLFLHWEVDARALEAKLPPGLDLDTYEDRAFVTLTPFSLSHVRPVILPSLPLVSSFHEVNVRTYVHRGGAGPGIWFFSLDTDSLLSVIGARALYRLPYFAAHIDAASDGGARSLTARRWHGQAHLMTRYRGGTAVSAAPGSLDFFLIERYRLYAGTARRILTARVSHVPYRLCRVEVDSLEESFLPAAGLPAPAGRPLAHYAAELRVRVHPPTFA